MPTPPQVQTVIRLRSAEEERALYGLGNRTLRRLRDRLGVRVTARGGSVTVHGDARTARSARRILEGLIERARRGEDLSEASVDEAIAGASLGAAEGPGGAAGEEGRIVRALDDSFVVPRSDGQKEYVEAIEGHDIVFVIGPAGTGKTYLAVACAVAALRRGQFRRLVLTRPAVEAGEHLGFLPGDFQAKVNPYLRPLYDALGDLIPFEEVQRTIERDVIEVAPLAYMRGRAQPLSSLVLTPDGFRTMGSLVPGDLVIGSDGRPKRVLGVHPQGRKEVFRVRAQDGASTLCCGEHLWSVQTRDDRRRNRPPRVLETREMAGHLRAAHYHRYELPLLSRPVEFPAKEVPLDPYSLGLLLGDGCITGKTTPSFATSDEELVASLAAGLPGIEVQAKGGVDFVLRNSPARRRAGLMGNPLLAVLRELDLEGTRSSTKFIPEVYRVNSSEVRVALLQGLLDTDGGPVVQEDRTCRVQYVTTSPRLRDQVTFLVRSLGGVVYARTRRAEGRRPGRAKGRDVVHRSDAHCLDLRLPAGIAPFRLKRKLEIYERVGCGRPMRFVDSIEPAGRCETACIRVDAEDSLYVTDDFLLTHNTLDGSFIILDEAQNTTPEQMKMFLTRMGRSSKIVVTGDVTQVDLPAGKRSGLLHAAGLLADVEGIGFVRLGRADIVRHPLVQRIVDAYEVERGAVEEGLPGPRAGKGPKKA